MRGATFLGLTALSAASMSASLDGIQILNEGTLHRPLYDVEIHANGTDGLAAGDRGTVLVTTDGGSTWTERQLDTQLALLGVALEGGRRLAVGQMGLIRYSDDGETWHGAESNTSERLLGVDMNGGGLAVAVGSFGTIRVSSDSGETWRTPDFDVSKVVEDEYQAHLNDVHVAGNGTVLVVGEFGLILRSTDGGTSWTPVHQDSVSLFGLHVRDDGIGYAVGQTGTVLKTTDTGATWTVLNTGVDANLLGVWSGANGIVLAPGMRHMIVSRDDGASWTEIHGGDVDRNWYLGVTATDEGMLAVGHATRVIQIGEREQ